MKPQKRVFRLRTWDMEGKEVNFEFDIDHHVEQVLRGLVHSGYVVTISEMKVDYTEEELKEMERDTLDPCEPPRPLNYALRA